MTPTPHVPQPQASDHPHAAPKVPSGEAHWQHVPLVPPNDVFDEVLTFQAMGLRDSVLKGLNDAGYAQPTHIQAKLIPPILSGKDVLGQAKTGTGKTAAFGLPLLHSCPKEVPFAALILVPTRELCMQVAKEINELGKHTPIKASAVYGGQRMGEQIENLKRGPQIIVSTPGRLMDMVERGYMHLNNVRHAVLDEVDRMLDIGFRDDIRKILGKCPPPGQRQTIFVSATLPTDVERLARSHSKDAEKIVAVTKGALTTSLVRQFYLAVQPWDKRKLLLHLLTHEEPALTLIFCRMKRTVDELTEYLNKHKVEAHAMHGDMYQTKRNKIIDRLHKGELSVLVASDLASRGLDVDGITHVINYDMPEDPEIYVHRIGRTARIGREGVAWSLVTPEQGELLTNVELLINMEVPKLHYPDFKASPPPGGRALYVPPNQQTTDIKVPEANAFNRYAVSAAPPIPSQAKVGSASAPDPTKFPGGIVPSKLPPRRMFGKIKSTAAMKEAINASLKEGTPPKLPGPDGQ